ncbi:MAG: hypothetical protein WC626_07000 [Methanoregula sp.]
MIECNTTSFVGLTQDYSGIIGPIIGGCVAGAVGLLVSKYNYDRSANERKRIVARAFFEEISRYSDGINLFLEEYGTEDFDEAIDKSNIRDFIHLALKQIVDLGLATTGPYATFLQEKNSFTVFFEDIYKFEDVNTTLNLIELYRLLVTADKHYHNYCHDPREPITDFRKFLETIEDAVNLIHEESILNDLIIKSKANVSIRKKISMSLNKIKHQLIGPSF